MKTKNLLKQRFINFLQNNDKEDVGVVVSTSVGLKYAAKCLYKQIKNNIELNHYSAIYPINKDAIPLASALSLYSYDKKIRLNCVLHPSTKNPYPKGFKKYTPEKADVLMVGFSTDLKAEEYAMSQIKEFGYNCEDILYLIYEVKKEVFNQDLNIARREVFLANELGIQNDIW